MQKHMKNHRKRKNGSKGGETVWQVLAVLSNSKAKANIEEL